MDYFVSIENTPSDLWQIELLIESFKLHNLQDDLLIAIAGDYTKTKNLAEHKRIICHNFHPFNTIFSLIGVLRAGFLKEPFVFLHPDMILLEPFKDVWLENIVFHPQETNFKQPRPFAPGGVIRFNLVPYKFFYMVLGQAEKIKEENLENEKDILKAAWTDVIIANQTYHEISGQQLEVALFDTNIENIPIIHYRDGLPPVFHKNLFSRHLSLSEKNPYETLLEHNTTIVTNYVKKVIHSYKGEL
jgi:hypothetical protein